MQWQTYTPEASFPTVCNGDQYAAMLAQQGGPEALAQWRRLEEEMRPLQQGAATFPAAALRSDVGTCLTFSSLNLAGRHPQQSCAGYHIPSTFTLYPPSNNQVTFMRFLQAWC